MYNLLLPLFIVTAILPSHKEKLVLPKDFSRELNQAKIKTEKNRLIVSTGVVQRTWKWTGKGLVTVGLQNLTTGQEYLEAEPSYSSDWQLPGVQKIKNAKFISLSVNRSTDEGYTSTHLEATVGVEYPDQHLFIQYVIWVYPDSPGIRTQLRIKSLKGYTPPKSPQGNDIGISPRNWKIKHVDSWQKENEVGNPRHAFDRKESTDWITDPETSQPHEIQIDLGKMYPLAGFGVLVSQGYKDYPSIINNYKFYVSKDGKHWGKAVVDSSFFRSDDIQTFSFKSRKARYVRLVSLSDIRKRGLASLAEMYLFRKESDMVLKRGSRTGYLPVQSENFARGAIGYYNDLQHRNYAATDLLKEVEKKGPIQRARERVDWANIISFGQNKEGFCLVKESQKCVNQQGYRTGAFIYDKSGVSVTGCGLAPADIQSNEYRPCWATWTVVYQGGGDGRQLALKQFDRDRYPVDTDKDMVIMANTWGSGKNGQESREKATESEVIREIHSTADLGIDVLQIDDGWNGNGWSNKHPYRPIEAAGYIHGWEKVNRAARDFGIKMGLWFSAHGAAYEDLKWNYKQDFSYDKLDGATMSNYKQRKSIIEKVRRFISFTDHRATINWDVTENAPRVGYFWAKEYGSIYLENRKPKTPGSIGRYNVYKPSLVLRDNWEVSKYLNLNKFQLTIENIDRVDREKSDAYRYTQPYAVAMSLMGTPIFFQTTYLYNEKARQKIRPLLDIYKSHRKQVFNSYIFPLGEKPNNQSWTGFQAYNPNKKIGYILIFRELHNRESDKEIGLKFLDGKKIRIVNLRDGNQKEVNVNTTGKVKFQLPSAPSFKFLKYQIIDD